MKKQTDREISNQDEIKAIERQLEMWAALGKFHTGDRQVRALRKQLLDLRNERLKNKNHEYTKKR